MEREEQKTPRTETKGQKAMTQLCAYPISGKPCNRPKTYPVHDPNIMLITGGMELYHNFSPSEPEVGPLEHVFANRFNDDWTPEKENELLSKAVRAEAVAPEPPMSEMCAECGFVYGEHAREALFTDNQHGWKWQDKSCPFGPTPFNPDKVFRSIAPEPKPASPECRCNCNPFCGCICHKQQSPAYVEQLRFERDLLEKEVARLESEPSSQPGEHLEAQLLQIAKDVNGSQYHEFVTHVILPIVARWMRDHAEPWEHQHDWFESDQWGTLKCRLCGLCETQLSNYGERAFMSPEEFYKSPLWKGGTFAGRDYKFVFAEAYHQAALEHARRQK